MQMELEKLRARAEAVVPIPEHYHLEVEDSVPKGEEKRRWFIWENSNNEAESIEMMLDLETGSLYSMRIDYETDSIESAGDLPSLEDAQAEAERFAAKHAEHFDSYICVKTEEASDHIYFTYREQVGGIPLPNTGCELTVNKKLEVIRYYSDKGRAVYVDRPVWPEAVAEASLVLANVMETAQVEQLFAHLSPQLYDRESADEEYRLVYKLLPDFSMIDAVTGENLFGPEHYVLPPAHPIEARTTISFTLPDFYENLSSMIAFYEQLFDIDGNLYKREEAIDEQEAKYFFYRLDSSEQNDANISNLTVDSYIQRKLGDKLRRLDANFIIVIERSTGRLLSMQRKAETLDDEAEAAELLDREQCWEKAAMFLSRIFPEYATYLRLEEASSDSEPDTREFFYMQLYVNGVSVDFERAVISVCKRSGKALMYRGVSYTLIERLKTMDTQPIIAAEAALSLFKKHAAAKLRWFLDDEGELPSYRLIYDVKVGKESQRLHFIDASNGEPIWQRKDKRSSS